jgi:hypothetical protein
MQYFVDDSGASSVGLEVTEISLERCDSAKSSRSQDASSIALIDPPFAGVLQSTQVDGKTWFGQAVTRSIRIAPVNPGIA